MIRLDIHEYCDACCDFDPDVTKPTRSSFATELNKVTVVQTDTIITCKNAKRCESIKRYLERQAQQGKNV